MSDNAAPWHLRRATADDVATVTACAVEAFRTYIARLGLTPRPMTRDYAQAIAHLQVWVAERPEQQIGAALLLDVTDEGFLIDVIAVHPDHQGSELAEREALRQGHASIYLFTNEKMTENLALYQRIGYVEYRRESLDGRTRVYLRKPLTRA